MIAKLLCAMAISANLALTVTPAQSFTLSFNSFFFVDITDNGGNEVLFTFRNTWTEYPSSSIADVYFDVADGLLNNSTWEILDDLGVSFSSPAHPPSPPGSGFHVVFSADSDDPISANGVNPGERLRISVDLMSGKTFVDIINTLDGGSLTAAIHAQSLGPTGEDSEWFGSSPSVVPEPTSLILLGTGLLGLGVFRRFKNQLR